MALEATEIHLLQKSLLTLEWALLLCLAWKSLFDAEYCMQAEGSVWLLMRLCADKSFHSLSELFILIERIDAYLKLW